MKTLNRFHQDLHGFIRKNGSHSEKIDHLVVLVGRNPSE